MRPRFLRHLLPVLVLAALPTVSPAGMFIGVSVNLPPPPLPLYAQPPCPQAGYIWVPGYWAWGPYGYYWVPGTWVLPPEVGLLWTPGWWGWDVDRDDYRWHSGYWGPRVGFYGGIDYGYGYDGAGFDGGYWRGRVFFYNRAVDRLGPGFDHDAYYRRIDHPEFRHVSFNGGPGGIRARPTRFDRIAAREHHFGVTWAQQRQIRMAVRERALRANFNRGRPPIAATMRPADFHGRGVFGARAAGGPMRLRQPVRMPQQRTDRPPWASHRGYPAPQIRQRNPRGYGLRPRAAQPRYPAQPMQARQPAHWQAPRPWQAPQQHTYRAPPRFSYRAPPARVQPRAPWSAPAPRIMPHYAPRPFPQRVQAWRGGGPGAGRPMWHPRGGHPAPRPGNRGGGPGRRR